MTRSLSSYRQFSWAFLIALALFVRAAVPQGYMLQEDRAGGIEVALCSSSGGTVFLPLAEPENGHENHQDQDADHSGSACHFSGHSEAGDTPPIGPVLVLADARRAGFAADIVARISLRHIRPVPPATGPPVTV